MSSIERHNRMDAEMVAPGGVMKDTADWVREIYKAGHAIVHDKILVIDPFSDKCVVATGSLRVANCVQASCAVVIYAALVFEPGPRRRLRRR